MTVSSGSSSGRMYLCTISMETKKLEQGIFVVYDSKWMPDKHNTNTFNIYDNEWYHVKENIFIDSNWTQEAPR